MTPVIISTPKPVKPTDKAISHYYSELQAQQKLGEQNEGSTRFAFENLLREICSPIDWTVTAEKSIRVGSRNIRLDGIVRDEFGLRMGYWEAKDAADDLDREIRKKFDLGYPSTNIIFEDTKQAVLIQNGQVAMRADLAKPESLAGLLTSFIRYTEPDIQEFHAAIDEFHDVIPELGQKLIEIIRTEHRENSRFRTAFEDFADLCRNSINPNLAADAVQEMIAQHLLTERLIRKVFENPDFTRRNAIAAEIEKVIDALTGRSFSRDSFMKRLDRFYVAIEKSADGLEFREKQTLLNQVYERFFQGFAVKVADTHGIVYTPQEIVQFMVGSVAEVLKTEFGTHLGADDVVVLDPCTGTGNFLVNILQHIATNHPSCFVSAYRKRLFANEVMLMPYYIASLNMENLFFEQEGKYEPFEGLCFVDTLDLAETRQATFSFMSQENTARVRRQRSSKINVIIGNPPYNAGQVNENDNNKNRKYEVIDERIRQTYVKDSSATNKNKLYDPYVRFFRWASDRINKEDKAVVCLITNNSFIETDLFDGMRRHLYKDYDKLFVIDLKGDIRRDSMKDGIPLGEKHTVFGLSAMVGISITILIKNKKSKKNKLNYFGVDFRSTRQQKFHILEKSKNYKGLEWVTILPKRNDWIEVQNIDEFESFIEVGNKEAKSTESLSNDVVFQLYSCGIKTNRDNVVYGWNQNSLSESVKELIRNYGFAMSDAENSEIKDEPNFFNTHNKVNWSEGLKSRLLRRKRIKFEDACIRPSVYRPFTAKSLYYNTDLIERQYQYKNIFPHNDSSLGNLLICCTINSQMPFSAILTDNIPDTCIGGRPGQTFPFYTYTDTGERRENITDWALVKFQAVYEQTGKGKKRAGSAITKRDIFHYVYAVLHHPVYRERFAEALKKELPRIPLLKDFHGMAAAGLALAELHLNYEQVKPYPLSEKRTGQRPPSQFYVIDDRMRLSKDKTALVVNDGLTLEGIPPEAFQYRLGNRSAFDWIIDQYQVVRDKSTGEIKSNPNRDGDPEYIVRLVLQIITVSLETNRLVERMPVWEVFQS